MKKLVIFILFAVFSFGADIPQNVATKDDIKVLIKQMDKRFEQVNKRFEQIDKRLDFMQNILYVLMGLIFASPFVAIYLRDKRESEERKTIDNVKSMLFVLREQAEDNEKLQKSLKAAGLL